VDARVVAAPQAPVAFVRRWRASLARLTLPAAAFGVAWTLLQFALNLAIGVGGWNLVLSSAVGSVLQTALVWIFAAMVDAAGLEGRQRMSAMIAAALIGSAIGVTLEGFAIHGTVFPESRWSMSALVWANIGLPMALFTGAVLAYDHHLRARRRAAALQDLRMRAATAGRRAAMVRLQVLQARIDPRFLFESLKAIERDYEDDPALGDRLLERLIAWLRAMLPDLHNAASTLGRELDRAAMWSELQSAVRRRPLALAIEADIEVRASRFASMIVIPVAEAMLAAVPTAATMTIRAERAGARVALRVRCEGIGDAPALDSLRRRLAELYGDAAVLAWTQSASHCEAALEIPDETNDGDPRRG
jgi:hypothetical protein